MDVAIKSLTPEQIREWSLEKKDKWWLENVYKGHAPQLTLRAAITGMLLGGILCLTNLYVGIKTGWTLGVGITSVTLSFAIFKLLAKFNIGSEMSTLENNAMQSVATSAGYMTAPLIASVPAYMLLHNEITPQWQVIVWIILLSTLGVLFAFPLKKRFINDEQLPFPEGYAAGMVMDNLHTSDGKEGLFKAKILVWGAAASSVIEVLRSEKVTNFLKIPFLKIPEYWDNFVYKYATPSILGTPLNKLTIQFDSSIVLLGAGGLMGIKAAFSLLVGAILNFAILAPIMISKGIIAEPVTYKNITMWSLWPGVAMMTTASLYSFFSKPEILIQAFKFGKKNKQKDILADIELPLWISVIGIPVVGILTAWFGHEYFQVNFWLGLLAVPLVFVFSLIAVTSTGLTSITPGSAIAKLTQLTYSFLAPGNVSTNLMSAGISSEVTLNTSNLLMDIKPGYMLGAKPRQQAVGHMLGVFAGALVAVPVFYLLFNGDLSKFNSETLPLPSTQVWLSVAKILSEGIGFLHPTAIVGVVIGGILGIVFEFLNGRTKGRFPLSAVGLGLAFVVPFNSSFIMALGGILCWFFGYRAKNYKVSQFTKKVLAENSETLAAGIIAGGSIIGIVLILLETFVLK